MRRLFPFDLINNEGVKEIVEWLSFWLGCLLEWKKTAGTILSVASYKINCAWFPVYPKLCV